MATSQTRLPQVDGFILAGGKSSRFGSNKALAMWKGRPLLAYATAALKDLGLNPRVVCRDPLPYFELANAFVTSERPDLGPLEGLRVALKSSSKEFAFILTGDMPLVTKGHLRLLLDAAADQTAVVFVSVDGIRHPFPGLYPRSALPMIEGLPKGSSVQALLDRILPRRLTVSELHSVNTPADLRSL